MEARGILRTTVARTILVGPSNSREWDPVGPHARHVQPNVVMYGVACVSNRIDRSRIKSIEVEQNRIKSILIDLFGLFDCSELENKMPSALQALREITRDMFNQTRATLQCC